MVFDARRAKLLQPGEHLVVDGCAGLRLEVSASRKTWTYRYKAADGRMKQVSLGQWPALSVHEAASRWQALRDLKAEGIDPRQHRKAAKSQAAPAKTPYTVRDVVERHVAVLKGTRKAQGAEAAKRALDRLLDDEPDFAASAAATVTRSMAFDILERRKATPTAAAKLRSLLGAAWDDALDAGKIGEAPNWWRQVMRGKLKSKGKIVGGKHIGQRRPHLTPVQAGLLLAWAPGNLPSNPADMLALYLRTGLRGGEISHLRAQDVTEEADGWWWTVPKEFTKNAHIPEATDLRVPLVGDALAIVQRRAESPSKDGWLFAADDGAQYRQHRFSTYIYDQQPHSPKFIRREGRGLVLPVTGWTPHHLRRTTRTILAALGCPNEIGEAIIGHLPEAIVATYNAYTYDRERRHWLTALNAHLDQLVAAASLGLPARP